MNFLTHLLHNRMHKLRHDLFVSLLVQSSNNNNKNGVTMDELKTIQKLDDIIQDLRMDDLHEIADRLEIEKQKIGSQFNKAEANSQIDIEELLNE